MTKQIKSTPCFLAQDFRQLFEAESNIPSGTRADPDEPVCVVEE